MSQVALNIDKPFATVVASCGAAMASLLAPPPSIVSLLLSEVSGLWPFLLQDSVQEAVPASTTTGAVQSFSATTGAGGKSTK